MSRTPKPSSFTPLSVTRKCRWGVEPAPEGLDGDDDARLKRAPREALELNNQGPGGTASKFPEDLPLELEEDPQFLG